MNIILTGKTGIGKTTVCEKIVAMAEHLRRSYGGFLTTRSEQGITVINIRTGEKKPLASLIDIYKGPHTGKYFFNPEGIDFGIRAMIEGISSEILFIDEIGHLELKGEGFAKAIEILRAEKIRNCVMVIRKQLLPEFLPRLARGAIVIETTINNRNKLPEKVYTWLNF